MVKGRVAVLMGGPSGEHAISLKSGRGVVEALRRRDWEVHPVEILQALSTEAALQAAGDALQRVAPDVAFLALHGPFGEDGTIQQCCEELGIAYTGSGPQASRIGLDKLASRKRFERAGLAVPQGRVVDAKAPLALRDGFAYPVVVKPIAQGSSLGVSIVREPSAMAEALAAAAVYGPHVLVEPFVAGRELTVGILGEEPLPVIEIRPCEAFFNYTAKYTTGRTDYLVPAPLPPALASTVQAAGLAAHRALGCRHLSRADMILTPEGSPVVLEVNTIPGFTPTSLLPKAAACLGISYDALCEQLVLMVLHAEAKSAR